MLLIRLLTIARPNLAISPNIRAKLLLLFF